MSHSEYACPRCFSLKVRSTLGPGMYCDGCEKSEIEYGEARLAFTVQSLRQQITELQKKCRAAEKLISDSVECVDFMLEMYPAKTNGVSSTMGAMQFDVWQQYYFLRKRARIFQKDYPKTEA